jgi:hypothetical protein
MVFKKRVDRTASYLVREVKNPSKVHRVNVYTTFILVEPLSGPSEWVAGTKAHKLENGDHVNRYEDGTMEWVRAGIQLEELASRSTVP